MKRTLLSPTPLPGFARYYEEPSSTSCHFPRNSHSVIRKLRCKFWCHCNYARYYRFIFNYVNKLLHFVCRKFAVRARIILWVKIYFVWAKLKHSIASAGGPLMVAQWLRYCATNRNVAGSIPDGVTGIFH
jgi:hypothetical protein